MGFRITTNMMMNTYRYNLQSSAKRLSDTRDMVMTQRKFSSYADDPAAATLAFRLRREYLQTSNYLSNTTDVYSKFNTAWHNLTGVVEELSDRTARVASIRGVTGTAGESRRALAIDLRETANSVIQAMNQQLGDHFIFGGNDALNPPFTWSEDGKTLYYRGVNVNAGRVKNPAEPPEWGDIYTKEQFDADVKTADETIPAKQQELEDLKQELKDLRENDPESDRIPQLSKDIENLKYSIGQLKDSLPKWWNDYTTNEDRENNQVGQPENVPKTAANEYEQAWKNYYEALRAYNEDTTGTLSAPKSPAENKPGWVQELENPNSTKRADFILDEYGTLNIEAIEAAVSGGKLRDIDEAWIAYYQDQADVKKLDKMSGEEMYIDLGMGAAEKAPNSPTKGTYFNNALCGIDFLGYGVDEDGDPLNLALIMRELADVFDTWDEDADPQGYNPDLAKGSAMGLSGDELAKKAERLMDKLKAAQENTTEKWVELDASSVYLQSNESLLKMQMTDLNIQILDVEQVDMADAITAFSWEQYCYNAALKIGNQLLSQSLIDYMS